MRRFSQSSRSLFQKWGRQGGQKRAKRLSSARCSAIASIAARKRWGKGSTSHFPMPSVRLEEPDWEASVYLEEVLAGGGLKEWRELYCRVADHPFGVVADALERVVRSVQIYGATPLWQGILKNLRGAQP